MNIPYTLTIFEFESLPSKGISCKTLVRISDPDEIKNLETSKT